MKISIRIKILIALLAFSLGPLLLSRTLTGKTAARLRTELIEDLRTELLDIISVELEHNARSLLQVLESKGDTMSMGTMVLANDALGLLSAAAPPQIKSKPYFSSDFLVMDEGAPDDLHYSDNYYRLTRTDRQKPLMVSYEQPIIHLAPDVRREDVESDIQRLLGLVPTFQYIYRDLSGAPYTLSVTLESGVQITYPGRTGIAPEHDSRKQLWYLRTKNSSVRTWTAPAREASTKRAVGTACAPIRDKNGTFLGAASIDVPLSATLFSGELENRWMGEVHSFMVSVVPSTKPDTKEIVIHAQQSYDETGNRRSKAPIQREDLVSDNPEAQQRLLRMMDDFDSGYERMPYKGEDCIWAYASNPSFSFMLIAPVSVVAQLPNAVAATLTSLFDQMRNISAAISGGMLILILIIAWYGARATTKPLLAMADAARRLASGDFDVRLDFRAGDERDILCESFNNMVPKLKERLSLRRDMALAQDVQHLLLPGAEPVLPGFDISGGISYCDQTGGDYYDFVPVHNDDEQAVGVILADVSGHGVPSALIMASVRSQLHTLSAFAMRPDQRITAINDALSRDLDGTGRFVTAFYLRLKADDSAVRWVRAGHDPAIRYTPETGEFSELAGSGIPLGVMEGYPYAYEDATLVPGDILVMATDGVWEARNSDGEMFGKKRMLAIIQENAHKRAQEIRLAIMRSVEEFQAGGQEDDIAVVVVKKD